MSRPTETSPAKVQVGPLSRWTKTEPYPKRLESIRLTAARERTRATSGISAEIRVGVIVATVATLIICCFAYDIGKGMLWPATVAREAGLIAALKASVIGIPLIIVGASLGVNSRNRKAEAKAAAFERQGANEAYSELIQAIAAACKRKRADAQIHISAKGNVTAYTSEWVVTCDPLTDTVVAANLDVLKDVRLDQRQLVTSHSNRSVSAIDATLLGSMLFGQVGAIAGAAHSLQLSMPVVSTSHSYVVDCYTWDPTFPVLVLEFDGDEKTAKAVYGMFAGLLASAKPTE